eukprot:3829064-Rhodomonas_salina.1
MGNLLSVCKMCFDPSQSELSDKVEPLLKGNTEQDTGIARDDKSRTRREPHPHFLLKSLKSNRRCGCSGRDRS